MELVICIGNEARGDDGVARTVARMLEGTPGVRVLSEPQLDVLMAEEIACAARVTFVDAERRDTPLVRTEEVAPGAMLASSTTHSLDPAALLALTDALYGRTPSAVLVTLAAPEMGHTEGLSAIARAAAAEGAVLIRTHVADA